MKYNWHLVLIVFCFSLSGDYLQNPQDRDVIASAMDTASRIAGWDLSEQKAQMKNMRGEKITYNSQIPSLYTIKDGLFILTHSREDSFSSLKTEEQDEHDKKWFAPSSDRDYRLPFVNDRGRMMKKGLDTQNSIYFLRFRKELPSYIFASGNSRVVFIGNCPGGKECEVWLEDDAQLVVENFSSSGQLVVHARDNSRIVFKQGRVESLYVSSRGKGVTVDLGSVSAQTVFVNVSNGHIGKVQVNPIQKYFKIGDEFQGFLSAVSSVELVSLNSKVYKAKRFFLKSIPNNAKKTVCGVVLAGGYAVVIGAIVASVMYGVFPSVIGFKIAASTLMSATVFYSVATRIRRVVKNIRPENFVKTSI